MDVRRLLLPLAVVVGNATAAAPAADPLDIYRLLDADGDGVLTYEEARVIPALVLAFEQMDTDASGGVDYGEFSEFEPAGSTAPVAGTQGLDLEVLDINDDDRIDRDEASRYPPLSEQWARYDADNNGYIDRAEFNAFEADARETATAPEGAMGFEQLDTNRDRVISQEEAASDPRLVDKWLELDRDESGSLDQAEFSHFQEAAGSETGDDGEATPRERSDAYRERQRRER